LPEKIISAMAKNLVIVESPAKAKTIEKFLGAEYQVESSFGHIADLPAKEIGVDVANGFKPKYEVSADKKALVTKLRGLAKKADMVWLASDEDREGEAISWHLAEELNLDKKKTKRIVFHEITKTAILKAIENPREIDYNLVNAQQARRVLDRLVGYELSPVLWRKIKGGLSAGRVQSVSVRLIVEREREVQNFKPVASYSIVADFINEAGKAFKAKLPKNFNTKKEAEDFLNKNIGSLYNVADLEKKPTKRTPAPPFTTSTLQQEASRKLYNSVLQTMTLAQRLYEAGLITYMRTDSVNLSKDAMKAAQDEIIKSYGKEFSNPRIFKNKSKGAQEAHEAIRPTDMSLHTANIDRDQARLYDLIWKRTLASQMADAELERTNVKIVANNHQEVFTASGEIIKFEGFLKVYLEGNDDEDEEQEGMLPALKIDENLLNNYITATERFTRPPSKYTEAALVKKLEELGIGRPSTYAPTITTIINRNYVEKGTFEGKERKYNQIILKKGAIKSEILSENTGSDKGKLVPTDIGMIVTDFLVKNFESILDYNFTAKVEQDFDEIAEGNINWSKMMQEFYDKFHPTVINIEANAERESGERVLGVHPETGKQILVRLGKFGPIAQIGAPDDEEKKFASLNPDQNLGNITLDEALKLFLLPKNLGIYKGEEMEVSNGRYGPFIRHGAAFISLPKGENPLDVTEIRAQELIDEKALADAPIAVHKGESVQKGTGRFGPFLKWNGIFINVSTKYNFNNLSQDDIEKIIEDKIQKNIDKVIHNWEAEGILVQKARWGRFEITKGKIKIELSKDFDAAGLTLAAAQEMIAKKTPAKKTPVKKTTTKKAPAKKAVAKKKV
jgi:DNA topoisomerase I